MSDYNTLSFIVDASIWLIWCSKQLGKRRGGVNIALSLYRIMPWAPHLLFNHTCKKITEFINNVFILRFQKCTKCFKWRIRLIQNNVAGILWDFTNFAFSISRFLTEFAELKRTHITSGNFFKKSYLNTLSKPEAASNEATGIFYV